MKKSGLLVVISAPSGGGKTTIIQKVLENGDDDCRYSISATTREQRAGEIQNKDYYFLTKDEFEKKKQNGEFVEWAEVHGHYYGTLKAPLEKWLQEGKLVFLDLDVYGGLAVKKYYGDSALLIFIKPPSFESLRQRLKERNTETDAQIEKRLQRFPFEMELSEKYDFVTTNYDVNKTIETIRKFIQTNYVAEV